jgi:hypothetical protein
MIPISCFVRELIRFLLPAGPKQVLKRFEINGERKRKSLFFKIQVLDELVNNILEASI